MTSNNNTRSHGAATATTTTLGIPSFNQSQTYDSTDEGNGDGVSITNNPSYISTLTANTTDISAVDEDNSKPPTRVTVRGHNIHHRPP